MNEFERFLGKDLNKHEITDSKNFIMGEKKFGKVEKFFRNLPIIKDIIHERHTKNACMVIEKGEVMFHVAVYPCRFGIQIKALSKINTKTGAITTNIVSESHRGKNSLGKRHFKDEASWNAELLYLEKIVIEKMLDKTSQPKKISFKGMTQEEILNKMKEGVL